MGVQFSIPGGFEEDLLVDLSNANAVSVMSRLGLDTTELIGSEYGVDFACRVTMAAAILTDDDALPGCTDGGPGTGRVMVTDLGRREGYMADVYRRLLVVADAAIDRGVPVQWS